MTKEELVNAVAERTKLRKKDVNAFLKAFTEVITETLKQGDKVAKTGRNPNTGERIRIPAKLVPAFKPGKDLKKATERVIKK